MTEIVGYVAQIEGHFSATSESGSVRRLQEGDPVHQNETVDGERENAPQARLSVALDSDTVITLAAGQSQRFDSQLRPVAFSETETQTRPDTLAALLREFGPALPADAAGPSDTAPRGAAFKTASRALEAVEALLLSRDSGLPPDSESAEALAAAAAHVAAAADAVTEIRNAYAETVGADAADGAHESLATARHQLQEASRAATAALVAATELQDTLDALFSAAADADEAHPDASAAHAAARSAHDAAAAADAARRAVTRLRGAPYSDTAVLK